MAKKTFVVVGATGHIGTVVAECLLKKGHHVKALGRDPKKLEGLKTLGAEVVILPDFTNQEVLTKAFKGADGVFSFIPPAYGEDKMVAYQNKVGEAIKTAIEKNKISYVINLSSIGAQLASGTGPIKGLHDQEKRLNSIPNLNVVHLRPAYFMENLFWFIPLIKQAGISGSPVKGDLPIPMIATKDIGLKAAELLDQLNFKGQTVFEFGGPRLVTLEEATKIIGKAIGKPDLKYVQFSYTDGEKGMTSSGMKPDTAKQMIEMYKAFNEGSLEPTQKLQGEHQGKTSLEQFSEVFVKNFKR